MASKQQTTLNDKKTVFVYFARNFSSTKVLKFGALNIEPSSTAKYLRVLLDNRLRFMENIATEGKKLRLQCGFASNLRHFFPR